MASAGLTTSKKRLALAIIDFLNTSAKDGTLHPEDAESVEIATNCISEVFKVDASDTAALSDAVGGQNLLSIYSVYEKLKGKGAASTEGAKSASDAQSATPQAASGAGSGKKNEEAEKLKGLGNAAMAKKEYNEAIEHYTQALNKVPLDPIYLSNRAAAYSAIQKHKEACADAELAVAADPKYTKAWSRLGLAKFALGDAKGAMEAYKAGIDAEGNGGSEAMKKGYETAKRKVEAEGGSVEDIESTRSAPGGPGTGAGGMPDLSSLAGMFGGGGAGGGGGMPNFAEMMNNPMMRQMAQNIMSNPDALNSIMSNPRLREMAESFGGGGGGGAGGAGRGGGMPDLSSLMQDPSIREM
jgi:small glutamine-rich tetratricopeptide repeat-containing protein alpha